MSNKIYMMIFKNTTDSIRALRVFDENKFKYNLMPEPSVTTGCCGTTLVFTEDVYNSIKNIEVIYKNIYVKTSSGFELIE